MKTRLTRFLMLACMVGSSGVFAQDVTARLSANLEKWRTEFAQEKVYLHHDKPYYAAGQQVWLKAYVLDAATLKPTSRSSVLYVDLFNAEHEAVHRLKLKIAEGRTHGDFTLPGDLPGGVYRLIAYTQWMRNVGEENFFRKEITVAGHTDTGEKLRQPSGDLDLRFFPEGGDLVSGVRSTIAFKAVDDAGRGVKISGTVYNDRGQKITNFSDLHLGMGSFFLTPEQGHRYIARINSSDGSSKDFPIPDALPEGFVLTVDETTIPGLIDIRIRGNTRHESPMVLTAISRDMVNYSKQFNLKAGEDYFIQVSKEAFPTGIARFNLSFATGEPLAERLVFINHHDHLNVTVTTDKPSYRPREEVKLKVEVKDKNGNPVSTDFALAVTDDELVLPDHNGLTVQSYLLLNADLRGHIEQPGYYFKATSSEREEALRLLLMTQGWRRFTWKDALTGNFPAIGWQNETDLVICGRLVNQKGEPVKNGEALLYVKDQHDSFILTDTDSHGRFCFDGFNFSDSIDMVIQGTDAKGRRKQLVVEMDREDQFISGLAASASPMAFDPSSGVSKDFLTASQSQTYVEQAMSAQSLKAIFLKEVTVIGERTQMDDAFRLHQRADAVLFQSDLPVAPSGNILEVLQGRVAGLRIVQTGPNEFRASIRGQQGEPLYLLDGMPIAENSLMAINQFDISRIEILKNVGSAAIYGGRAANGVIAFYTRTGVDYQYVERLPGRYIIIHRAGGYSKVREFYSPQYGESDPANPFPDLRTTVYWNPSVQTDEKGIVVLSFFAADRSTTYRAVAEGVSPDGITGRSELTFGVKRSEVSP